MLISPGWVLSFFPLSRVHQSAPSVRMWGAVLLAGGQDLAEAGPVLRAKGAVRALRRGLPGAQAFGGAGWWNHSGFIPTWVWLKNGGPKWGSLVYGQVDQNLRNPSCLILSHTHFCDTSWNLLLLYGVFVFGVRPFLLYHRSGFHFPQPCLGGEFDGGVAGFGLPTNICLGQNHQGTAGFSPCFHLPGFHFGWLFFDPQLSENKMWANGSCDLTKGGETTIRDYSWDIFLGC